MSYLQYSSSRFVSLRDFTLLFHSLGARASWYYGGQLRSFQNGEHIYKPISNIEPVPERILEIASQYRMRRISRSGDIFFHRARAVRLPRLRGIGTLLEGHVTGSLQFARAGRYRGRYYMLDENSAYAQIIYEGVPVDYRIVKRRCCPCDYLFVYDDSCAALVSDREQEWRPLRGKVRYIHLVLRPIYREVIDELKRLDVFRYIMKFIYGRFISNKILERKNAAGVTVQRLENNLRNILLGQYVFTRQREKMLDMLARFGGQVVRVHTDSVLVSEGVRAWFAERCLLGEGMGQYKTECVIDDPIVYDSGKIADGEGRLVRHSGIKLDAVR